MVVEYEEYGRVEKASRNVSASMCFVPVVVLLDTFLNCPSKTLAADVPSNPATTRNRQPRPIFRETGGVHHSFAYSRFKEYPSSLLDGSYADLSRFPSPSHTIWASLPNLTNI